MRREKSRAGNPARLFLSWRALRSGWFGSRNAWRCMRVARKGKHCALERLAVIACCVERQAPGQVNDRRAIVALGKASTEVRKCMFGHGDERSGKVSTVVSYRAQRPRLVTRGLVRLGEELADEGI